MATLLIIASLALNLALLIVTHIILQRSSGSTANNNCRDYKRNIEGRITLSEEEISINALALISNTKLSHTVGIIPQTITDKVVSSVVEVIKDDLESKPHFINMHIYRDYPNKSVVVDFHFDFTLKNCLNIKTSDPRPRIINTHY